MLVMPSIGHIRWKRFDSLKKLADMSTGVKPLPRSCLCIAFVKVKLKETPHNHPMQRGTYPLEVIHVDIAGPFLVTRY